MTRTEAVALVIGGGAFLEIMEGTARRRRRGAENSAAFEN
jgi:hypothetical protein